MAVGVKDEIFHGRPWERLDDRLGQDAALEDGELNLQGAERREFLEERRLSLALEKDRGDGAISRRLLGQEIGGGEEHGERQRNGHDDPLLSPGEERERNLLDHCQNVHGDRLLWEIRIEPERCSAASGEKDNLNGVE